MAVLALRRLSTSTTPLLFCGQAISLAHQITEVNFEGLRSPELYVLVILRVKGRWWILARGQGT